MGIRIENKLVIFESICMEAFNPEHNRVNKKSLEEYIKKHPFPEDKSYIVDDMIYDLTISSGMLTLPISTGNEVINYIQDLLNEII